MANKQGRGEEERGSSAMARAESGERGMARRQYQDPFSLIDSLFERMQQDFFGTTFFNSMLPSRQTGGGDTGAVRVPRLQMRDTGNEVELTAELPGIPPEKVQVECEGDVLTIRGEAEQTEQREGQRMERRTSFYREVVLPDSVDTDQAQAAYKNGVLNIRFPKRGERSSAKQIPIATDQPAGAAGREAKDKAA
jgi:HSP20 family protein